MPSKRQIKPLHPLNVFLNVFLSVWVAFFYLGLAFFYPATCAPGGYGRDYTIVETQSQAASSQVKVASATYSPGQEYASISEVPTYITASSSSNTAWLLDSQLQSVPSTLLVIKLVAVIPFVAPWAHNFAALDSRPFWSSQFFHQFQASPPDQPPQFIA